MPEPQRLFRALEATWPPASTAEVAGWTLRVGAGGGKRVSAATAGPGARAADAPALVQVRPWDPEIDAELHIRGYKIVDKTVVYCAPIEALAGPLPHATAYWAATRLAIMEEIWAEGGIGPARLAVMDRAAGPRTHLLCRTGDRAAGTGFVAAAEGLAMVHALEVLVAQRRGGAGRLMMRAAANWALRHDAPWLALAVTEANAPARALYEGLGMAEVARYHYRVRP